MSDPTLRDAIALYDRFTHEGMDRRAFMAELTRIAGGGAAAAMLLTSIAANAQAGPLVAENDPRINASEVSMLVGDLNYTAYNAGPVEAAQTLKYVLVVHENRGLNAHIRDVSRRLAVAGYTALAPDFLSPAGGTPADEDRARQMIGALDMVQAVSDGVAMIREIGESSAGGVGAVGFCWGGGMVNRLAVAAGEALRAAVPFYGPAPDPAEAVRVSAAELIILAGRDERVNATARPWAAALRAAGKDVTVLDYPDVDHAFHNDTSAARYDRVAAEQAWAATLAFFRRHLGA